MAAAILYMKGPDELRHVPATVDVRLQCIDTQVHQSVSSQIDAYANS